MKINEVENLLQISRANIRYYEKEGLISIERRENHYRDYTEDDILRLKRIIVLRKLGLSIEEIRDILEGKLELEKALKLNIERLEQRLTELQGALDISRSMVSNNVDCNEFDAQYYWKLINNKEKQGNIFFDVCKDCARIQLDIFDTYMSRILPFNFKEERKKKGPLWTVLIVLLICLVRGAASKLIWQGSFWEGFLEPFFILVAASLLSIPLILLGKRYPKVAGIIAMVLFWMCIAFFVLLALLIVLLLLNSAFHFLY